MANKRRRCTACKKYKEVDEGIAAPVGFSVIKIAGILMLLNKLNHY